MCKVLISLFVCLVGFGLTGSVLAQGSGTLSFLPTSIQTDLGDTFSIDVVVEPRGQAIDTARAFVKFDPQYLEIQYFELGDHFPFASPGNYADNSNGFVYLGGYLRGEQTEESGVLATLTFKSKQTGSSTLNFLSSSKLISVGQETIDLSQSGVASVVIVESGQVTEFNPEQVVIELPSETEAQIEVTSPTNSNQNVWQALDQIAVTWEVVGEPLVEVTEYYYSLDKEPEADPGTTNSTSENTVDFQGVEDGVWYFHLKALLDNEEITETVHYRLLVDTQSPDPLSPVFDGQDIEVGDDVNLRFRAIDQTSGVWYYEIEIDDQLLATQENEIVLNDLRSGNHKITVKAFDLAGNWVEGTTELFVGEVAKRVNWMIYLTIILPIILIIFLNKKNKK